MLLECCDAPREGLIRIAIFVSGERRGVRVAQLATGSGTPGVQVPITHHCNGVGLATGNLPNFLLLQHYNQFRLRLVGAAIFIFRHRRCIRVTELTAATTTPRVEASLSCECDRMCIATCDLNYADIHK